MPQVPGARAAKVLNAVYDLLLAQGTWPKFADLDRHLDMHGEPDAESVLLSLPSGLTYGVGNQSLHDDQEIALSVAGLAACVAAAEDLAVFLRVVRFAAVLEQEQLPGEPKPELRASTIERKVDLPAAGRSDLLRRLVALLRVEPWGWSSASLDPDSWSFAVDRRVRRLRDVASITDYWERTREDGSGTSQSGASADTPPPTPDQAIRLRAWLELHLPVPRLVIVNASEAEVRNVVPTVHLLTRDRSGDVTAMIGGSLGRIAEISPGGAFVVELHHFVKSAKDPGVESQLHIEFDDARGQRWQLAHGSVVATSPSGEAALMTAAGELLAAHTLDLATPVSGFITSDAPRVAFISYVHEDVAFVDHLQASLEAAGITVWRDLNELFPGDSKRRRIHEAIRDQSFAFLACFSAARAARRSTYANEELSIALDVLRTHNTAAWFIPVRFDDTPLPPLQLGLHGTVDDIIWANLFGDGREDELRRLIAVLQRLV